MVTYDLKGKEKNSKKYYETAREISKKIVRNIMITGEDFLSDYMKYIEDNKIESLRSSEEYSIEILLIGVLMLEYMDNGRAFMNKSVNHKILELSQRLDSLSRFNEESVSLFISPYFEKLQQITKIMNDEMNRAINQKQLELSKAASMLNALSPLAVLGRGYSLTLHNDAVVTSASEVKADDLITTRLKSSTIISRVTEVKYE